MPNRKPVNILLVDDQPANLLVMQTILGELDENLVCANSGEEALRAVLQMDFAVILLDVRMPTLSGFDTARLIRSRLRSSRVAILFITAALDAGFPVVEAYALGAVDFLTKPILPDVLRAKVAFFVDLFRKTEELGNLERIRHAAALNEKDERIRVSEERFSLLVNSSGEGIYGIDLDFSCTFVNAAGAAMLGYQPEELVGQQVHSLIHHSWPDGSHYPEHECRIATATREGSAVRVHDEVFWHKNGAPIPVSYSVAPMVVDGKIDGAVVTFSDITDRKHAEDELRKVAAELSELDRRKTEFLATLAHELRNPLAPLRSGLEVMRLAAADPALVVRTREIMDRQLGLLIHLVDDLLDVSRITNDKIELQKVRIELREVVNSALETSLPLIEAAGHKLIFDIPAESMLADVDPLRIAQVVSNLLNNAAKYTPAGGRIELSISRDDDELRIAVTDNGVGIPEQSLYSIFDMFIQLRQNEDRSQGGLGIGLTLVHRLVKLHGGRVFATSRGPNAGSTFNVILPAAADQAIKPAGSGLTAADSREKLSFRILVVDDNVDAADSLSTMLDLIGHTTRVAYDGHQGVKTALNFIPDVIFLDIGMPGMNGYEVARVIRKDPAMQHIALIALTGWGTDNDRARSQDAGFNYHLTKPASLESVGNVLSKISDSRSHH